MINIMQSSSINKDVITKNPLIGLDFNIVFDGNSLTACVGATDQYWPNKVNAFLTGKVNSLTYHSYGIGGQTLSTMINNAPTKIDSLINVAKTNVCVVWEDANDILGNSKTGYQNRVSMNNYVKARKLAGFNYVIVLTGYYPRLPYDIYTPTQSQLDEQHNYFEAMKNPTYKLIGDAVVDLRRNIYIGGGRNQNQNSTYNYDYIHLKAVGYDQVYNEFLGQGLSKLFSY